MITLYKRHLAILGVTSLFIAGLLYAIVTQPWGYQAAFNEAITALSIRVLIIGGFGYLFLTIGMLNVLYLYTLNRHKKPVVYITIAFFINLIVGLLASRLLSYEYASLGMLAGAIVFMIYTTREVVQFFKQLGYHYYAAY